MKRKSILLLLVALVVSSVVSFVGCIKPIDPKPTEYRISDTQIALTEGETKTLTVSPTPEVKVTWESSNESVATVSGGVVTAVKAGSATVSCKIEGVEDSLECQVTVNAKETEVQKEYKLEVSSFTLKTGKTGQIVVLDEEENTVTTATYESSNTAVATVSSSGLITAVAKGTAKITITVDGQNLECNVTVEAKTYKLEASRFTLKTGDTQQIVVLDEEENTVTTATYESSNTAVATVSNSGLITAVSQGTAKITVIVDGQNLECNLTVEIKKVYQLEIVACTLKTGDTQQIVVVDEEENTVTTATYESSNTAVATVSSSGLITAVAKGSAKITVTVDGQKLECNVTVLQKYAYSFNKTELDLAVGAMETLTLIRTPDDEETVRPHTFTSSDESVATVNGGNGKVTAVGKGKAVITCLVDGGEVKCNVTVTAYAIKINGVLIGEETFFRVGAEQDITVTPDPDRAVVAEYRSSDESVITVTDGHIVPLKEGEANIVIKVGGKEFTTKAIVQPSITYSINYTNTNLALGETLQLEVTSDPVSTVNATYEVSDDTVISVSAGGLVTAKKLGKATVTTKVVGTDKEFETEVNVVLASELGHTDYSFGSGAVNLTYLGANKTLDWRRYVDNDNGALRMKDNTALIGEVNGTMADKFWDYLAPVVYEDGNTSTSAAFTYGINFVQDFSIPITLNKYVTKVVILTGAWNRQGSVEFKLGDTVLQSDNFEGSSPALSRKYELSIDASKLADGETQTLTVSFKVLDGSGNVSLVAVAVVGDEAHTSGNATVTGKVKTPSGAQNLTEIGNVDWLAANGAHKASVPANAGILRNEIVYGGTNGSVNDYKDASFTWTDGSTDAPDNLRDIKWDVASVSIPVKLDAGKSTVTLYATGYIGGYLVALYDQHGVFVNGYQVADEHSESVTGKVVMDITSAEGGIFTVRVMKCRGGGNIGWAAIAVSRELDHVLDKNSYSAVVGSDVTEKITVSKNGVAVTEGVTYVSDNEEIATVSEDGTIVAKKAGTAYVTVTVGGNNYYAQINVIEYTLGSSNNVKLSLGGTSNITINSNPSSTATVAYSSSNEEIATVDNNGVITAVAAGDAKITVTVQGVSFEITVTVVGYQLSESNIELYLSADVSLNKKQLTVQDADGNPVSGVTFTSDDSNIASVDENGIIGAVGLGETVITAKVGNQEFVCRVKVSMSSELAYTELNMEFENLSRVSNEYKTIDYKHWKGDGTVVMPNGANVIGEPSSVRDHFWDYKATIGYGFEVGGRNLGACYGSASTGYTLPVVINNKVSAIVFYTGAYKGTATITFKIGDVVLGSKSFVADEGVARKIAIKIDTTALTGDVTLTVVGSFEGESYGNVNVVALAVVGKVAYSNTELAAATGSVTTAQVTGDKGSNKVNLTEVGQLDWIYSHYENPNDKSYRKFGGSVFAGESYYDNEGAAASFGTEWDGFSAFKWTDGYLVGSEATSGSANAGDSNEHWEGSDEYTNNYNTASGEIHVKMHLAAGKYQVSVYMNSWRAPISTAIYDGNGNFIVGKMMVNADRDDGTGWVATYTIEVIAEGDFNVVIGKSRSHGDSSRQVGWQAIAVSAIN